MLEKLFISEGSATYEKKYFTILLGTSWPMCSFSACFCFIVHDVAFSQGA